jgi:hypothetical protein
MSATNRGSIRQETDFYATPEWCVQKLMNNLPPLDRVLDPAAGNGAILEAIRTRYPDVNQRGFEIVAEMARKDTEFIATRDALGPGDWNAPAYIIMNPPFRDAQKFVERSLLEVGHNGTVCALLRLNWLAGQSRREFHRQNPADVYVLARRPSFTGGGTDATEYAWFVWGANRGNRWFML